MILVGPLGATGALGLRTRTCRLVSDRSVEELLAFAERIGLRPRWLRVGEYAYFELSPGHRLRAIAAGAASGPYLKLARRAASGWAQAIQEGPSGQAGGGRG